MFKLFSKSADEGISSPVSGVLTKLENVNDPVFATKMMGDGFAVLPEDGELILEAPVSGKIVSLPDSKHAIGIEDRKGGEILIHIGIDTVNLNGEGFQTLVEMNQKIHQGDDLIKVNINLIKEHQLDPMIMIIFLNRGNEALDFIVPFGQAVNSGEKLLSK